MAFSGSRVEHLLERGLGLRELLLLVEDRAELEGNRVHGRKLRLRVLQDPHRLRAAVGVRIDLRQRDVGERLAAVVLHRLFEDGDSLIRLAVEPQRPRVQPREPQVVRVLLERRLRDVGGGAVLLRGQVRVDQVAGDRWIARRQLARFLECRDRLVVLPKLLVREAEMRQEDADVERRVADAPRNPATTGASSSTMVWY